MKRRAVVARENQLAANLPAATFRADVTLPPATLSQKWVSGRISISVSISVRRSEEEEKWQRPPTVSTHQWNTHTHELQARGDNTPNKQPANDPGEMFQSFMEKREESSFMGVPGN